MAEDVDELQFVSFNGARTNEDDIEATCGLGGGEVADEPAPNAPQPVEPTRREETTGDAGCAPVDINFAALAREQMRNTCDGDGSSASAENARQEMEGVDDKDGLPGAPAVDLSAGGEMAAVAAPVSGLSVRNAGRVKTRLLGFNQAEEETDDPLGNASASTATAQREKFPVGWLVVVDGPGVGHAFSIFTGASVIGRGEDQMIRLDFGDNSISRNNHAAIAYDEESNKFYIGHGGKSNIIRRNARPVLSTEELHHADLLRIGETTLRFVALCGSDFQWTISGGGDAAGL